MTQVFNSREIATGIWVLVFAVWAGTRKEVRDSFAKVVTAFAQRQILVSVLLMIIYNAAVVLTLWRMHLWQTALLKDTIFWFIFTGFITASNLVTDERELRPVRKAIKDNLKFLIVFQFIVNTYTFSLPLEMLFVPGLAILVGMEVVASMRPEHRVVETIVKWLLAIAGLAVFSYSIVRMISDYSNFGTLQTLRSFLLPLVLTILLMPFIYVLMLHAGYQSLFVRLQFFLKESPELQKYAKRRLLLCCGIDLAKVRSVFRENSYKLLEATSRDDIDRIIMEGVGDK